MGPGFPISDITKAGTTTDSDIVLWRERHQVCPTCGTDLNDLAPESNLFPHFTGVCKQYYEAATEHTHRPRDRKDWKQWP